MAYYNKYKKYKTKYLLLKAGANNKTIITPTEKIDYIKSIQDYPSCKLYLYTKKHENIQYTPIKSKKQFTTLLHTSENIYTRLLQLISKHTTIKDINTIKNIIKQKHDDESIYDELHKNKINKQKSNEPIIKSIKDLPHKCGRNIVQAEEIAIAIKKYIPDTITNFLDYGCGDCIKTQYIGELINLPLNKIYGADIEEWYDYKNRETGGIKFNILEPNIKLPYKDNKFDLILAYMVLHHIPNLDFSLTELARIIKPGKYIILVEHDARTNSDKILCDIEHALFELVDNTNKEFFTNYFGEYRDWIEWDILMNRFGFKKIHQEYILDHSFNIAPTRKFYSIYQKN